MNSLYLLHLLGFLCPLSFLKKFAIEDFGVLEGMVAGGCSRAAFENNFFCDPVEGEASDWSRSFGS